MKKILRTIAFFRIYLALISFDLELRIFGFQKLFPKYVNRFHINTATRSKIGSEQLVREIDELLSLIDKVCAGYPFKAQCLHRSFLGYRFVRSKYGIPVNLVIGVRKFPFSSHAWLMFRDKNLNELEEYTSQFKIILSSEMRVA